MPQIFVLSGPDIGRSFVVKHGDTLGRSPECIVTLKHPSLSRRHAHFEQEGERWFIVDDDSRNGVLVDKQRTPRAELVDTAEFQLGELHLRFRTQNLVVEEPKPAPIAAPKPPPLDPPDEISLGGEDEIALDEDEPIITAGGGARAPVLRPEGDSPYAASGPFVMPKDESAAAPRRPGPPTPAPRKLEAFADELLPTNISSRVPPPPAPKLQNTMLDTGFGRAPTASAGATISRSTRKPGDGILQFNKVENTGGADLSQLSGPVRFALYAFALVLMLAIAWFAFRGASFLKSRASSAPDEAVEDVER